MSSAGAPAPLSVVLVEFTPSGGLFQFAVQLGEGLARRGHQVEVLTGPSPELVPSTPGLTISPVLPTWHPSAGEQDPAWLRKLRRVERGVRHHLAWAAAVRAISARSVDVVQFSGGRFPVDGLVPAVLSRRLVRPLLLTLAHAPLPWNEQRTGEGLYKSPPLLRRSLGAGYRAVDAVVVLGERTATEVRTTWPAVEHVEVIPHGDEGALLVGPTTTAAGTGPVLLFFGALHSYKGLPLLLDAFALLRRDRPQARLVIAGSPVASTDTAGLLQQAKAVGGVEVRLGYVSLQDVGGLFGQARAVVTPYSHANNSGVVALAHTAGRPVVATAVGDLPALVQDGVTGLLVPPADPAALAAALRELIDDPGAAARMGEAGRAHLLATGSWDVVAEQLEEVYRACAQRRTG